MIIKNNTDEIIERRKSELGLSGDVYIYGGHFIESLESHKVLIPDSTAQTIEEALAEREAYEEERESQRAASVMSDEEINRKHNAEFAEAEE